MRAKKMEPVSSYFDKNLTPRFVRLAFSKRSVALTANFAVEKGAES